MHSLITLINIFNIAFNNVKQMFSKQLLCIAFFTFSFTYFQMFTKHLLFILFLIVRNTLKNIRKPIVLVIFENLILKRVVPKRLFSIAFIIPLIKKLFQNNRRITGKSSSKYHPLITLICHRKIHEHEQINRLKRKLRRTILLDSSGLNFPLSQETFG